ncbi:MAG TPA: hypothetical protein VFH31_03365 [Pyrinomonadaceae bacterium]|nr:hypothetical protein [Pyrinomonadaceae bacterium]
MKRSITKYLIPIIWIASLVGCSSNQDNANTTATTSVTPPPVQILQVVSTPERILDEKKQRGEQEEAKPELHIISPTDGAVFDADPIMIDFWLSNAKLKGDGGDYRVRYIVDDDEPRYIDKWETLWLSGWLPGKHTVRFELLGPDNWPVKHGDLNVTTREITVIK